MKSNISGVFDTLEEECDPRPDDSGGDVAWCSESCKQKVREYIIRRYPCRQKFIKVDVQPVSAWDTQRYYRVSLWVNNWAGNTMGPAPEMWKTFYVTLEGVERRVVSIEEGKLPKLALGENGQKLMYELGILQGSGA